jgi:hypothetical protein
LLGVTGCQQPHPKGSAWSALVTLTLETCGRLGKPLIQLLGDVGNKAAEQGQGLVTKQKFVQGKVLEISLCLCHYNAMLAWGVAGLFVKASGIAIKHSLIRLMIATAK